MGLPSGKHTKNYGKSPFLMGKSTISMAMFNSKLLVYQRVSDWVLRHDDFIWYLVGYEQDMKNGTLWDIMGYIPKNLIKSAAKPLFSPIDWWLVWGLDYTWSESPACKLRNYMSMGRASRLWKSKQSNTALLETPLFIDDFPSYINLHWWGISQPWLPEGTN